MLAIRNIENSKHCKTLLNFQFCYLQFENILVTKAHCVAYHCKPFNTMKYLLYMLLMTLSANMTFACSCSRVGILKGQRQSDFVFTGKVVKINEIVTEEKRTGSDRIIEYKRYEFIFKIRCVHKGKKDFNFNDSISIITTGGGSDCGNRFDLDKKYTVYSYTEDRKLGWGLEDQKAEKVFMSTNLCTRTKRVGLFTFLEQFILSIV